LQLRRITTTGRWIPEIDGLRFIAIAAVLCFHMSGQTISRAGHIVATQGRYDLLLRLLGNGDRGVPLFFVISGYILARPFLREHLFDGRAVSLGSYFLRRITRLEPPYIISLLLYTVGFMVFPGTPLLTQLPHLLASVAYLHNLIYGSMSTINFVTWSLEIEVQFYILAPLLGMIYAVRNTLARRSIFLALILFCGSFHLFAHGLWLSTIFNYGHFFLAGFLMADLMKDQSAQLDQPRRFLAWDAVSLACWLLVFLLPRVDATLQWLPFVILPAYLGAFYGPISNWFFRKPWVAITGGMCYSFYLMHMLTISIAFKATRHLIRFDDLLTNLLVQFLTLGSCIYIVGTLFFIFIERPCMDPEWPQKLWRRLTKSAMIA
jgi:peptidoglycan/LPS O-acetylase OafA/YrhL